MHHNGPLKTPSIKLSIVIPVYNEEATIVECVKRVMQSAYDKEIIIVNDGSSDRSQELIETLSSKHKEILSFSHSKNRGKGAAIATGLQHVTGDIVIFQDADLEYNPEDYANLLAPIELGKADVVYGSRFRGGSYSRAHLFWHMVGNRFLTTLSNMLTNLNLTDMETGYKAFHINTAKALNIKSLSFAVEPEITAKISRMNLRIYEVPISYEGRNYNEGKKIGWKDGLIAIWAIFRWKFFPEKFGN